MSEYLLFPRGPSVYADLVEIIDTTHAEAAVDDMLDVIPPQFVERVRGNVREAVRRAYVDGLRDGFTQGIAERSVAEHPHARYEGNNLTGDVRPVGGDA